LWIYLIQTKTKVLSGLPLEGDSGEEVALWRLISLFRSSKRSSSRLIIMKSLPMSPSAYFLLTCHLWKCQYRARVYWNLSYPFSIFKMIFLESNSLRFIKTLLSFAHSCPSDTLPFFSICSGALPFVTIVDVFFHICY
jgi:hypothetical protein